MATPPPQKTASATPPEAGGSRGAGVEVGTGFRSGRRKRRREPSDRRARRLRELEKASEWRWGRWGVQWEEARGWPEEEKRRRRRREGSEWSCTIFESSRTAAIGPPKG
jgi:hypothetical protein